METQKYVVSTRIDHTADHYDTGVAFVHVPKTGGTYLSIPLVPQKFGIRFSSLPGDMHVPVSQIEKLTTSSVPLFTIVRDPYDRVCSEYYFTINKIKELTILDKWNEADFKKVEFLARRAAIIMKNEQNYEKICNIYKHNMSVDDYLEWSAENPTYPHYYDTKTPKDFDLVGITEDMATTIKLLKVVYQTNSGGGDFNSNTLKDIGKPYDNIYSRSEFQLKNEIEYEIYNEAKQRFNKLVKEYL